MFWTTCLGMLKLCIITGSQFMLLCILAEALSALAVQVRIMKGADDAGKGGPKKPMPDVVEIIPPKDEDYVGEKNLISKDKEGYSVTKEIEPVQLQPQAGLAGGGQP